MKTTTQPKKRGRPVGSKKAVKLPKDLGKIRDPETGELTHYPDSEATVEQVKDWSRFSPQAQEVEQISLPNKITLILTVVNVAILISLVIKNI